MRDPVGEFLEQRGALPLAWRGALLAAFALHAAVALFAVLSPRVARRPLTLPSVQVRIAPALPQRAERPAQGETRPRPAPPAPAPAPRAHAAKPAPAKKTVAPPPSADGPRPAAPAHPAPAAPVAPETPAALRSASGSLALGTGATGSDEPFPYEFYLTRLLGAIEANWFSPPGAAAVRCRVRFRIDRGGRLLEAGIEEASAVPSFDRAALRAVYAAAPFPPLPQGFGGSALTIHLEFGP